MKTVLLVCSNKTLVMFIGILLKRMGFGLVSASCGPDALGLIDAIQPDIVMIDSEIAVFDGLETLERMKKHGGPSIPPVIMMVGTPDAEAERRCVMTGACTVITKPVSMDDLHYALQECLFRSVGMMRMHLRARANIKVTVYHKGGEIELITESISAGGAYIRHDRALAVGSIVDLLVPFDDKKRLLLTGKVIYNQKTRRDETGLCPGFAVKFIDITAQDAIFLKEFVSRLITQDLIDAQGAVNAESGKDAEPVDRLDPDGVYSAMQSYRQD